MYWSHCLKLKHVSQQSWFDQKEWRKNTRSWPKQPYKASPALISFTWSLGARTLLVLSVTHLVVSNSFPPRGLESTRLLCPWDSPGKNTGVGCYPLLQGIVPTQGSNQGLLHCRRILYHLSHRRSPRTLLLVFKSPAVLEQNLATCSFSMNYWVELAIKLPAIATNTHSKEKYFFT